MKKKNTKSQKVKKEKTKKIMYASDKMPFYHFMNLNTFTDYEKLRMIRSRNGPQLPYFGITYSVYSQ